MNLSFVKLEILPAFRQFAKLSDEEAGRKIKRLLQDLLVGESLDPYTKELIDEAKRFSNDRAKAGKKGMEKRWAKSNQSTTNEPDSVNPSQRQGGSDAQASSAIATSAAESDQGSMNELKEFIGRLSFSSRPKPTAKASTQKPANRDEFKDFVAQSGICEEWAWEFYDMEQNNYWTDSRTGARLKDWKAALMGFVKQKRVA